ncbi:ribose ABC transporter substrate-binding protein [Micromonospora zingiberis]|uniref:Ribose ABC transporter substrate-binding protein n=1 Tax=Micromonospora zingiberis TaxID=2053011 RepID=A0A4R0GN89_9ACTN|nr:substrate-binding domain-containing protein [Micromonospora zingiberis]TCB98357.1 ribose ABC transporter substrate-binding protein [Micromonospora zingiberis]
MSPLYRSRRTAIAFGAAAALAVTGCSTTNQTGSAAGADPSAAAQVAVGNTGPLSAAAAMASVCGDKPIKVGLVDGLGTNSWSKIVRAEVEDEAKQCPNITGVEYVAGRGNLQSTLAGITSMASKGVNVLLVIPTAGPGPAHLSALRTAANAGVTVIPIAADPEGKPGSDYFDYVDWDTEYLGQVWAKWMVDRLGPAGGNIVMLGGPAGNPVSQAHLTGIKQVLAGAPQVKLLTDEPVTTNWDPAMEQQAMSGLLAKYPKIDGVISDYGAAATGVLRAYQSAGRPLVPIATTDDNELSCGFAALKASNGEYELATVSSRTWIGRAGLRKGVAVVNGKANPEPSRVQLEIFEDSTSSVSGALAPAEACGAGLPNDAPPSSQLSADQLAALFKG